MQSNPNEESVGVLCELCGSGALWDTVDSYLGECGMSPQEDASKRGKRLGRFPNLAGLCRYVHTGLGDLQDLCRRFPQEYDRLLAIFEDEALNCALSSTLLTPYIKKRLHYLDSETQSSNKEVRYSFEHDIYADGE